MLEFADFQKAIKAVHPFVPQNSLRGSMQGVEYSPETGILFASNFSSGIYYLLSDKIAEAPIFLPESFLSSIEKIPQDMKWSGISKKKVVDQYEVNFGKLKVSFMSLAGFSPRTLPEFSEDPCEVLPQFIETIDKLSEFMCQDDRKVNLYGLYCGEDAVYSCDNVRILSMKAPIPSQMVGTFLPFSCVETIKKKKDIKYFQVSGNLLVFGTPDCLFHFNAVHAQFPPAQKTISDANNSEFSEVSIDTSSKEFASFSSIFSGGNERAIFKISFRDDLLFIETEDLFMSNMSLSCGINYTQVKGTPSEFLLRASVFLDGLRENVSLKE